MSDQEYRCPQCGPDPAGAEIHAETHHTLPSGATDDHEVHGNGKSEPTRIQPPLGSHTEHLRPNHCPCGCGRLWAGRGLHPWHEAEDSKRPPLRRGTITLAEPDLAMPRSRWRADGTWDRTWVDNREQPPGWGPGDEECAGCETPVLAGAESVVARWSPHDRASHWWHPGCWASYQDARKTAEAAGTSLEWPEPRGLYDGMGLAQAARP